MRNPKTSLYLAVVASAGMLVAQPAVAADPVPSLSCSAGTTPVSTTGLSYVACPAGTCTKVTYTLGGTPADHVATFVRAEAGTVETSGSYNVAEPCAGDSVIGVGANTVCHERIIRFNNKITKSTEFSLQVNGRRKPIATSIVVKKGNSQSSCTIAGIGLEDVTGGDGCVSSCGNFSPNQTITKVEIIKFKGCEIQFEFDTTTGAVMPNGFNVISGPCSQSEGSVDQLTVTGPGIEPGSEIVSFGDGWVSSGTDSCTTRFVAGRYYSVCQ